MLVFCPIFLWRLITPWLFPVDLQPDSSLHHRRLRRGPQGRQQGQEQECPHRASWVSSVIKSWWEIQGYQADILGLRKVVSKEFWWGFGAKSSLRKGFGRFAVRAHCLSSFTAMTRELIADVILFSADNFRPYITSFQGNNCTDYINAVFVDVSIEIENS